jgi:ABC-type spermidine/putrescine transport system permease subunit II
MFSYLQTEINPTIAAVSTLLITAVVLGVLASVVTGFVRGRRRVRHQASSALDL